MVCVSPAVNCFLVDLLILLLLICSSNGFLARNKEHIVSNLYKYVYQYSGNKN